MSKRILVFICVIILVFILFYVFKDSEEKKILKQLNLLSEKIEKNKNDKPLYLAAKTKGIEKLLMDEIIINIPSYGFTGNIKKNQLISKILMGQKALNTLKVDFYDINFSFIDNLDAQLTATIDVKGTGKTMKGFEEPHEITIKLKKHEGVWKFIEFSEVMFLEK